MPSHNILLVFVSLHNYALINATSAIRFIPDSGPRSSSPIFDREKETDGNHMWIISLEDVDL